MVHLDYRDARPIYTQIAEGFRDQITGGVLLAGDKLPSVRELAVTLSINPNTIQRAYRELEAGGWIVTEPGKGCFVCPVHAKAAVDRRTLLAQFDQAAATLIDMGMDADALIARLKGGSNNA